MRWKYLIPRFVIVAMVWSFFAFAFDPILRWGLIRGAQAVNGAKVDIDKVATTFFPPSFKADGVQIADRGEPGFNRLQFDAFEMSLAGKPLFLKRKLIVEEGKLTGLKWGAPRADSGQLERKPESKAPTGPSMFDSLKGKLAEQGKTWFQDALGEAKAQLDPNKLTTVKTAKSLKAGWLARFKQYDRRIKDLEKRVKALKDKSKVEGNAFEKARQYQQLAREVNALVAEAERIRTEMSRLYQSAGGDLQKLQAARDADVQAVKDLKSLVTLDKKSITESLIGEELVAHLETASEWIRWTREKVGQLTHIEKPVRSRGVDVLFPRHDPLPGFLIRRLDVTGEMRQDNQPMPFQALITDVTSDPKKHGVPTVVKLLANGSQQMQLDAKLDLTGDVPTYEIIAEYVIPTPSDMMLGEPDDIAVRLQSKSTRWNAHLTIRGMSLSGNLSMRQNGVRMSALVDGESSQSKSIAVTPVSFEINPRGQALRAMNAALGEIHEITADVELTGSFDRPQWKMDCNLGQEVAGRLRTHFNQELERTKQALAAQVQRAAQSQIDGFRNTLTQRFQKAAGNLNVSENQAKELVQKLAGGRSLDFNGLFRR